MLVVQVNRCGSMFLACATPNLSFFQFHAYEVNNITYHHQQLLHSPGCTFYSACTAMLRPPLPLPTHYFDCPFPGDLVFLQSIKCKLFK